VKKLIASLLMATSILACDKASFVFEAENSHKSTGIFCNIAEDVMKIVELTEKAGNSIEALKKTIDEFNAAHGKDPKHPSTTYACAYADAEIWIDEKPVKTFKTPSSGDAEVLAVKIISLEGNNDGTLGAVGMAMRGELAWQKLGNKFEMFTARSTTGVLKAKEVEK